MQFRILYSLLLKHFLICVCAYERDIVCVCVIDLKRNLCVRERDNVSEKRKKGGDNVCVTESVCDRYKTKFACEREINMIFLCVCVRRERMCVCV